MHARPGLVLATLLAVCPTASPAQDRPEPIAANRNVTPAGALDAGTLTLRLEAREGFWSPQADDGGGVVIQAFGEEGGPLLVPGPLVRVPHGTRIDVSIRNRLGAELVLHGMHARPGDEGDTLHVAAGATRTASFTAGEPGTYFYWGTTTGEPMDVRAGPDSQLGGAFIIDPAGAPPPDDRVFVLGLWFQPADTTGPEPHGEREIMTINGKSWPDTERLAYTAGETVRWRWINATSSSHPMHLHGFYFQVDGRGDWASRSDVPEPDRVLAVTDLMLPGATMDLSWVPEREGNWLFHCHFAFHVSHELHLAPVAAAGHDHGDGGGQAHVMAGLVLGIHVLPGADAAGAVATTAPRRIRLVASRRTPPDVKAGPHLRYALDDEAADLSAAAMSPLLLLRRSEPVAITVVNRLAEPTAVHWHGIELESFPDGVPGWSGSPARLMPAIAPQDSFVAEFVPPRAGTFIYHSHANELDQILGGLTGALLVVDDPDAWDPERDRVFIVTTAGSGPDEFVQGLVNGRRELDPLELRAGETYRFRFINIGDWRTLFTLLDDSGYTPARLVAKDGADLARPRTGPLNLLTGPGETADYEVNLEPGTYRLEFKQQLAGWIIPLEIRVRAPR
jgi:manganese oxidase